MGRVLIRQLAKDDWELYKNLRLRSLQESPEAFGSTYERESEFTDERWRDRVDANGGVHQTLPLVAEIDEQAIGIASGVVHFAGDNSAYVYQMWVAPESRGQGAARLLLDRIISWASLVGVDNLNLGVNLSNSEAIKLYQSAGFTFFGEQEPMRPDSSSLTQSMTHQLSTG